MLPVHLEFRRLATPLLAVALGAGAALPSEAAASVSPAPRASPSPSSALMDGLEIRLTSAKGVSAIGKGQAIHALGTFVVIELHLKNLTTVVKRAELESSFLTTPAGARYPVSNRAMVGLNAAHDLSAADVLHEVAPGFEQTYELAFDVPKGHREFSLHLLAPYPDVGQQRVFPVRL